MGSSIISLTRENLIFHSFIRYLLANLPKNSTLSLSKLIGFMKLLPFGSPYTQKNLQEIINKNGKIRRRIRLYIDDIIVETSKTEDYIETI